MTQVEKASVFAVLGDPVEHSRSPAMHNAAFAARGLPHLYLRARVGRDGLRDALGEARRIAVGGLNLTVPLKETACTLVDDLTPTARAVGAVNTVVRRGRRLIGDNTDAAGFLRALPRHVVLSRARVVLIGAGGSARAVGVALAGAGCRTLVLANRTPARASALAERLARLASTGVDLRRLDDPTLLRGADLVVNATSTGLTGAQLPLRPATAPPQSLFVELLYGHSTPFLRAAARAGRPTLDGTGMLLHQGALAFEAWTGRRAPLAAMTAALDAPPAALRPSSHVPRHTT